MAIVAGLSTSQMKYEFEVGYDRITNFDAPGYTNKEISTFLTKAQEEFVLDLIKNGNHYKEEFKKSLSKIKTFAQISTNIISGNYPLSFTVNLPENVLIVINDSVDLLTDSFHFYPNTTILDVPVKPVDDDYYHANKKNPFKKPSTEIVWRLDDGLLTDRRHTYIVGNDTLLATVYLHYYKKLSPIIIVDPNYNVDDGAIDQFYWHSYTLDSLDCTLDTLTHRQIVDRAVKLAYAAVQDEKGYQISAAKEQEKNIK